jgi:hypothetical protein
MQNGHFIISDKFRRTQIGVLRREVSDDPGGIYECPDRFAKQPRELPVAAFAKLGLAAEAKSSDDLLILFFGTLLDVIQQLAALGNQGEKATAGREVLLVDVQVVRQMENPSGEERHLIRGAAGVSFVELIVFNVDFFGIGHGRRGWIQRLPDRPRLEVERGRKRPGGGFAR